jgi:hypothetical protein
VSSGEQYLQATATRYRIPVPTTNQYTNGLWGVVWWSLTRRKLSRLQAFPSANGTLSRLRWRSLFPKTAQCSAGREPCCASVPPMYEQRYYFFVSGIHSERTKYVGVGLREEPHGGDEGGLAAVRSACLLLLVQRWYLAIYFCP